MTSLALNAECQEDLLDLIEKSFVTFQEDLENECVDQAELKKQLQQEREVLVQLNSDVTSLYYQR